MIRGKWTNSTKVRICWSKMFLRSPKCSPDWVCTSVAFTKSFRDSVYWTHVPLNANCTVSSFLWNYKCTITSNNILTKNLFITNKYDLFVFLCSSSPKLLCCLVYSCCLKWAWHTDGSRGSCAALVAAGLATGKKNILGM